MILDEIVSIKKIGTKTTVDIQVDGDSLFYCNGILTHNSAAGDVADVTEESIQGGISKIQSADNVLAFIPSSGARDMHLMKAKWLKSRDSGAVGKYIMFKIDWSTLTFAPTDNPGDNNGNTPTININSGKTATTTSSDGKETMAPAKKGKAPTGSSLLNKGKNRKKVSRSATTEEESGDDTPSVPKEKVSIDSFKSLGKGNSLKSGTRNKNPKLY